jgi:hypothetical protein
MAPEQIPGLLLRTALLAALFIAGVRMSVAPARFLEAVLRFGLELQDRFDRELPGRRRQFRMLRISGRDEWSARIAGICISMASAAMLLVVSGGGG